MFCYKRQTDEWTRAPALNEARTFHSSCILGSSLYVYGGYTKSQKHTIERLTELNGTLDTSSILWKLIEINAERTFAFLMTPQSHTEKILILGTSADAFGNKSLYRFEFNPKTMN